MKIMTLNLNFYESKHGPWSIRRELIVEAIRRHGPDVVAFQAVRKDPSTEHGEDQATQFAKELPEWEHVAFVAAAHLAHGKQDGSAFLSRLPFDEVEHRVLDLGAEPHEAEDQAPRLIIRARMSSPALSIFNSHYSWAYRQAASNVTQALRYMRQTPGPAVLVGDLNTSPDSDLMRRLAADGWTDVWAHLCPDDPGYTFESQAPDKRIDYVWARAGLLSSLKAIELVKPPSYPHGARLSDHLGLVVTLS